MLNREWICSWSSADRRCSNYIWVINNFISHWGATYIRALTVSYWCPICVQEICYHWFRMSCLLSEPNTSATEFYIVHIALCLIIICHQWAPIDWYFMEIHCGIMITYGDTGRSGLVAWRHSEISWYSPEGNFAGNSQNISHWYEIETDLGLLMILLCPRLPCTETKMLSFFYKISTTDCTESCQNDQLPVQLVMKMPSKSCIFISTVAGPSEAGDWHCSLQSPASDGPPWFQCAGLVS